MSVVDNYKKIKVDVDKCSMKAGHKVELLAVSKNQSVLKMDELANSNVSLFGESKVQEALPKINYLSNKYNNLEFHFIGKVQTNKLKKIVEFFHLIHSVDREDVLSLIDKYALELNKKQHILIQLNIACEKQKNGRAVSELENILNTASHYKNIVVKGLMFMPPYEEDVTKNIKYFETANKLFCQYKSDVFDTLSMGMSHDFKEAIEHGSTLVRVGTNIFGERGEWVQIFLVKEVNSKNDCEKSSK